MKDEAFIEHILEKIRSAKQRVLESFPDLTPQQFNWKPSPTSWSIAECLEHLVISDSAYFPDLQRIAEGKYKMTLWERYSPFTGFFGKVLKSQLEEQGKRKMKTNRKLVPTASEKDLAFLDDYSENLDAFLYHISSCRHADLDSTIITSPFVSFITYSLRDAFEFLARHEHRHINQALRVRDHADFPKKEAFE